MASRFQDLINSRLGVGSALTFARLVPSGFGYRLADLVADSISSRQGLEMVQAVRKNQWMVSGRKATGQELNLRVKKTFRNTAQGLFDLYRTLGNPSAMEDLIVINPAFIALIEKASRRDGGLIIVTGHINQGDIIGLYAGYMGARPLGLMFPDPGGGYQWQNDIRSKYGIESLPTDRAAIKAARNRLVEGGTVMTAVDRPIPNSNHRPNFFGKPAPLPLHYVMLALKTDVPIVVVSAFRRTDGRYEVIVSDPVKMEYFPEREASLLVNAEKILKIVENMILAAPHQWAMYYPVWPDIDDEPYVN